jgi:uroporphyrinogen decarboxylase
LKSHKINTVNRERIKKIKDLKLTDLNKNQELKNNLFIKACYQEPVERTPVWMMRQAGRYLPEYRAIRKKHDFLTMYKTPELAAEVTLQPVDLIGVDAAILFSDILVIPEAMGMKLTFAEGRGPVFDSPIREINDIRKLRKIEPEDHLSFVLDAIRLVRKDLDNRVPLIGFSGAPWTLTSYMLEGGGSKNFTHLKKWRFANQDSLHQILERVTEAVILYIKAQINAGAQAIQLFDTWVGLLDPDGFFEFALPYVQKVLHTVKTEGIPLIYFAKGGGLWLDKMIDCGADVLGLDWTIDIGYAKNMIGNRVALQGNLDPTALLAPPASIRAEVKKILRKFGKNNGHIFNLGHGILPNVPPEHARFFVETVKEESKKYH